jgi:hypothetical protein
MANVKISELPLGNLTSTSTFPFVDEGTTYQGAISAITSNSTVEVTYDELYSLYTGGTLTSGIFYLMTDYQTCYDQPNYNSDSSPITTGNYKTGTTEPILLLAISTTGFSPTVYSTLYPQDKISYDISWNLTEVTSGPAKGRITERIDDKNNRADYDFRAVQFIRYVGYFSEQYYAGKINLDNTTGLVNGTETTFTNDFTVGDIFGVYNSGFGLGSFKYYEISSIVSNVEMYVTGRTLTNATNSYYSSGQRLPDYMNPHQCNITGTTNDEFAEYYTFNDDDNFNTYLGDNVNYSTFILSNNVFLNGPYRNNTFGGNVVGNTFDEDMDSNIVGPYCQYNIITDDFDRNIIGSYFQYNIIDCDMESNQIGNYFEFNMLGDSDGSDFDFNQIGSYFNSNFLTLNYDFYGNNIGESFYNNIIDSEFRNNTIAGNFNLNLFINNYFNDNFIGSDFYGNIITQNFYNNEIGHGFDNNSISGETHNNRIGDQFENNTIYGDFNDNQIFNEFKGNITYESFYKNRLDWGFGGNQISGYCGDNTFGPMIDSNDFLGDVYQNTFKGGVFSNTIGNNFANNNIGYGFSGNIIGEDFGNGYNAPQGNTIGNYFIDNTIGEYFYNNTIADNFQDNEVGNYFQWNVINTNINDTYFTLNYGNITGFSYTAAGTGATNNTYSGIQACGTTQSMGVGASFNVEVSGGTVIGVTGAMEGRLYQNNDELTILGTQIGGVTGVIDGFSSDAVGKSGTTGTYDNIFAQGTGGGENGSFNIIVVDDLVDSISLSGGGSSYLIGDVLTIDGSVFGGVDGVDDITITVDSIYSDDIVITVTGTTSGSSFYQHYTKQIFERRLGNKRVSFYDEDDILNVDSVYEISGYIPVYSQSLSFPFSSASFEFECDGSYTNNGGITNQSAFTMTELVTLFNSNFRQFGYFFDNNDGTIGLYINPSLKQQYCPSGTYTINVFNN